MVFSRHTPPFATMTLRSFRVPTSGFNPLLTSEFEGSPTDCGILVCLNQREITVIRKGLLSLRWPTRYGYYVNDRLFRMVDNSDVLSCIEEIEVKMGCNDIADSISSLGDAIKAGLEAIANKPCCDGNIPPTGSTIGGVTEGGEIIYGTEPPLDGITELPEGYTDEEQYNAQKCGIANSLVDGIIFTLRSLAALGSLNAIAATIGIILAITPFVPVAPALIPVLIPLVAIAWLASGTLYALSLAVDEYRQDFVCAMMSGDTISNIIDMIADIIDVMLPLIPIEGAIAVACKSILMILFNADSLNRLYEEYAGFMYPDADCSDCENVAWFAIDGTVIEYSTTTQVYTVTARQVGGNTYRADIQVTGDCQEITEFSISGYEYDPEPNGYSQYERCDHSVNTLIDPIIELSDFGSDSIYALNIWSKGGPFTMALKSANS